MAKPKTISPVIARQMISRPKFWLPHARITWAQTTVKRFPRAYKFRVGLEIEAAAGRVEPEGLFIQCYFKKSLICDVPDTLSITLLVQNSRAFGVDENGPSDHVNKIGQGQPYYQQKVTHPHIHIPVDELSYGYAEPLAPQSLEGLWNLFLEKANIHEAPSLTLPSAGVPDEQMELL
jgi:hypothetical protein